MVPPTASTGAGSDVFKRLVTGLLLGPPVLAALYVGSPYSDLLIVVAAGIMAWEWGRLCGAENVSPTMIAMIAGVVLASTATALGSVSLSGWILLVAVMSAMLLGRQSLLEPLWVGIGVGVIGLAGMALVWLRANPEWGREVILWLIAVVWATDSGAYFAGRSLGGPKLAPKISPKKTWSGLAGGVLCAGLVGVATSFLLDRPAAWAIVATSMLLALVSQGGDLFESILKRRFGAKDSSNLIPGHGGLLDRTDGLIAASLCVVVLIWFAGEARL